MPTNSPAPDVLVVDDNELACRSLAALLDVWGFECKCLDGGQATLDLMLTHKPSFIFLDIMMPGIDGFGVLQAVRANKEWDSVAIFMYTALSDDNDRKRAMELGATGYIVKGKQNFDEIRKLVASYVLGRAPSTLDMLSSDGK